MLDLASERRETGRPIGPGDLLHDPGRGYREVVMAANAGDCALAKVQVEINRLRSERRPAQEE